jgi:hypothetical protein
MVTRLPRRSEPLGGIEVEFGAERAATKKITMATPQIRPLLSVMFIRGQRRRRRRIDHRRFCRGQQFESRRATKTSSVVLVVVPWFDTLTSSCLGPMAPPRPMTTNDPARTAPATLRLGIPSQVTRPLTRPRGPLP